MAKIDCEVTNCSHNKSGECYANCVDIVGSSAKITTPPVAHI